MDKGSARIDMDKVKKESRFDGKWVLSTNTNLSAEKVALKYKELWQVERVFRDVKTLLETRPTRSTCVTRTSAATCSAAFWLWSCARNWNGA